MRFDLTDLAPDLAYKVLASTVTPRPIAWVTTLSRAGIVNAAPYSFFNVVGSEPPTVVLGILRDPKRGFKDTARNVLETGEFVVNLVPRALAEAMNTTCMDAPADVSELELAGLSATPSTAVAPPRITESPVSFECQVLTSLVTGPEQVLVVGRVLTAHVADEYVLDPRRAHIDTPRLDLIARLHGSGWYARSTDTFQLERPSWNTWCRSNPAERESTG